MNANRIRAGAPPQRRTAVGAVLAVVVMVVMGVVMGGSPASAAPGPPAYPAYWFDQWGIPALWARGYQGGGLTVAVIDTGVQASLPQLAANVVPGTDLTGLGGDGTTDRAKEQFSHGTAMASLIVARGGNGYVAGVAPQAKVMPIAVPLGETVNSRPGVDETAPAIRYAVDHGAKIISMSFGGDSGPATSSMDPCPAATQSAVFYALSKGAILVAAGGNSGEEGSAVEEPGVCLGVLAVGAVDGSDAHAGFSSVHPYLAVSAPGVNVTTLSSSGDVFVGAGTSQAAALTSGALALIWSAHPSDTNRTVLARLMAGLRRVGTGARDSQFGYGIVDAGTSIASSPSASTPNPVFTGADPFLAELAATPAKLTPPGAATGSMPVASAPRRDPSGRFTGRTLAATGAGAAGLVALIVLLLGGLRSRRRARAAATGWPVAPGLSAQVPMGPLGPPPMSYGAGPLGYGPPAYWPPSPLESRAPWEVGVGHSLDPAPAPPDPAPPDPAPPDTASSDTVASAPQADQSGPDETADPV